MNTLFSELCGGQSRAAARNASTVRLPVPCPRGDLRALFIESYPVYAAQLRRIDEPTMVVVAIDEERRRVVGLLRLAARPGRVAAAIIGRHGCADLFVEGPDDLSLRHLALFVEPARSWRRGSAEVGYRLVDLRTGSGFLDEHGAHLVSVRCEGSAFFRCGSLTLLVLAAGDPSDWPDDAADAWNMLPERVTFDERTSLTASASARLHPSWSPRRPVSSFGSQTTRVISLPPPRGLDRIGGSGEQPVGVLELVSNGSRSSFAMGATALREGVLLGRYDRCDAAALITDSTVSRTHLLLLDVGGRICALDTGSTNGTWHDGSRIRVVEAAERHRACSRK